MSDNTERFDPLAFLNGISVGWTRATGLRFVSASADHVTGELVVGPQHLQPYGLVHGGVYAGMVETLASVGAALDVRPRGKLAVGLENHTSFLRACRGGTLTGRATPLARGSRTQVWEVRITDDGDRVVATGRVRLMVLDPEDTVADRPLSGTQA